MTTLTPTTPTTGHATAPVVGRSVSRQIDDFVSSWSMYLTPDDRERLIEPLRPRLVGTSPAPEDARRVDRHRAYLLRDFAVRQAAPAWLDWVPDLRMHASMLRSLPAIRDARAARLAGVVATVLADGIARADGYQIAEAVTRYAADSAYASDTAAASHAIHAAVASVGTDVDVTLADRRAVLAALAPEIVELVERMIEIR